jgi:hypothetical protein
MSTRLPKFGNVSHAEAKEMLDGYILVKNEEIKQLSAGDNIKYSVEGVLKGGGILKTVVFPKFIAVKNKFKPISWCVQLNEPTLMIWVKTKESEEKEKIEKKKIWDLYKANKLMQVPKDYETMKNVYEMYKNNKLVPKK